MSIHHVKAAIRSYVIVAKMIPFALLPLFFYKLLTRKIYPLIKKTINTVRETRKFIFLGLRTQTAIPYLRKLPTPQTRR